MFARDLAECEKTDRRVVSPDGNWESTRLLLKEDNMGFSFHITTIYEGKDLTCITRIILNLCIVFRVRAK